MEPAPGGNTDDGPPLTPLQRRQVKAAATRWRRLLSGTLLPHHHRDPHDPEVDAMILEAQEHLATLERLLHDSNDDDTHHRDAPPSGAPPAL